MELPSSIKSTLDEPDNLLSDGGDESLLEIYLLGTAGYL